MTIDDGEPDNSSGSGQPWWRRPRGLAALGIGVAAVIVAGVMLATSGSSDEDPRSAERPPAQQTGTPTPDDDQTPVPEPTPNDGSPDPETTTEPTAAPDDDDDDVADDDATSEPTSPPADGEIDPDEAVREAERVLAEFLAESDAAYQDPGADLSALAEIAGGVAYSEVQAGVTELESVEWRQSGTVDIVEFRPGDVDVSASPASVELSACLDTADIDLVDKSGDSVRGPVDDGPSRTLHQYRVEHVDGQWMVVDHTFPDDADC
ncbi:hypothetical protein [Phytoactinopolyspora mesophila]|uniref:Uncharacterized protein n=1 Tax=Phytoactinopolyspora mesophila TaxID=2650750 RepID=A0A7K3M662_9ACTN|nr:hypothetical protein [Phytoactinopolyspora mesophila]NDL58507.1 hypothetical protein [Phytoactinopolyspora mesophila]